MFCYVVNECHTHTYTHNDTLCPETQHVRSEMRRTSGPEGTTALWFSRDGPGGAGGYDIWMARRVTSGWSSPTPVSFNSPGRDFDPAFSADGRFVYFCSDRSGGIGKDDLYRDRKSVV